MTSTSRSNTFPESFYGGDMQKFIEHMKVLNLSQITVADRLALLHRLSEHLPVGRLSATTEMLVAFQATYSHLAPASVDIYTRHIKAFYVWARRSGFIAIDPAEALSTPNIRKGKPHPTRVEDLATILACARGHLRTTYTLAAFAGLRCGEICRFQGREINRDTGKPIALIHGKGGKERYVPIIDPVMAEIGYGRSWIVTRDDGKPWGPDHLSAQSSKFIHGLGIETTLHSMRHFFATNTMRLTNDPMFVRDLLGHESLSTTEIYMESTLDGAHDRLDGLGSMADRMLHPSHLAVARGA